MTHEEVCLKAINAVYEYIGHGTITMATDLEADCELDSLDIEYMTVDIEELFDITEQLDLSKCKTVSDIVAIVEARVTSTGALQ